MRRTIQETKRRTRLARGGAALALSALLAACGGAGAANPGANNDAAGEPTAIGDRPNTGGSVTDLTPESVLPTAATDATAASGGSATDLTAVPGGDTAGTALTVSDIMENPEMYYGQQITVVGEAQRIFGSSAFKLDEDSFLTAGIDNDLVVIGAAQDNPAVETTWLNNQVQVTGTLRQYVEAEFEQEFNWFQPGAEWEGEIEESQPFLVADSVTRLEEGVFGEGLGRGTGGLEGAPDGTLTVAEVTANMATYAGRTVTVQGEVQEVYEMLGANVLRLDEDALLMGGIDNDLIVVDAALNDAMLNEDGWLDSIVRVNGTVRDFNRAELEQELGVTFDDQAFEMWDGEPVLVAESAEQVR
jgi:hypothetical protein